MDIDPEALFTGEYYQIIMAKLFGTQEERVDGLNMLSTVFLYGQERQLVESGFPIEQICIKMVAILKNPQAVHVLDMVSRCIATVLDAIPVAGRLLLTMDITPELGKNLMKVESLETAENCLHALSVLAKYRATELAGRLNLDCLVANWDKFTSIMKKYAISTLNNVTETGLAMSSMFLLDQVMTISNLEEGAIHDMAVKAIENIAIGIPPELVSDDMIHKLCENGACLRVLARLSVAKKHIKTIIDTNMDLIKWLEEATDKNAQKAVLRLLCNLLPIAKILKVFDAPQHIRPPESSAFARAMRPTIVHVLMNKPLCPKFLLTALVSCLTVDTFVITEELLISLKQIAGMPELCPYVLSVMTFYPTSAIVHASGILDSLVLDPLSPRAVKSWFSPKMKKLRTAGQCVPVINFDNFTFMDFVEITRSGEVSRFEFLSSGLARLVHIICEEMTEDDRASIDPECVECIGNFVVSLLPVVGMPLVDNIYNQKMYISSLMRPRLFRISADNDDRMAIDTNAYDMEEHEDEHTDNGESTSGEALEDSDIELDPYQQEFTQLRGTLPLLSAAEWAIPEFRAHAQDRVVAGNDSENAPIVSRRSMRLVNANDTARGAPPVLPSGVRPDLMVRSDVLPELGISPPMEVQQPSRSVVDSAEVFNVGNYAAPERPNNELPMGGARYTPMFGFGGLRSGPPLARSSHTTFRRNNRPEYVGARLAGAHAQVRTRLPERGAWDMLPRNDRPSMVNVQRHDAPDNDFIRRPLAPAERLGFSAFAREDLGYFGFLRSREYTGITTLMESMVGIEGWYKMTMGEFSVEKLYRLAEIHPEWSEILITTYEDASYIHVVQLALYLHALSEEDYPKTHLKWRDAVVGMRSTLFDLVGETLSCGDSGLNMHLKLVSGEGPFHQNEVPVVTYGAFEHVIRILESLYPVTKIPISPIFDDKVLGQFRDVKSVVTRKSMAIAAVYRAPSIFAFATRLVAFRMMAYSTINVLRMFGNEFKLDLQEVGNEEVKLRVHRDAVFSDGAFILRTFGPCKQPLEIAFHGENGIGRGPTHEFFTLFAQELRRTSHCLFRTADQRATYCILPEGLFISPKAHIKEVELLGTFVAKALEMNCLVDMHINPVFFKFIRAEPVRIEDVDAQLAKSVAFLNETNIDGLEMTFVYPGLDFPMIDNGDEIMVNAQNVSEWKSLIHDYTCGSRLDEHRAAFLRGFEQVMPFRFLDIFEVDEICRLISGDMPAFTHDDLRANVVISHGYSDNSREIRLFFDVVTAMSASEQSQLVRFITGYAHLPVGGLASLEPKLTIACRDISDNPNEQLPTVSSCTHYFKLPSYSTHNIMRERLLLAIREGQESFAMT